MGFCYALLFTLALSLPSRSEINLSAISRNMFTATCSENQYSDWVGCLWPKGDLRPVLNKFFVNAKKKGCKTPPSSMLRTAFDYLKDKPYVNNTLYTLLPTESCGYCGRKIQCCATSRSFLAQSYHSMNCDQVAPYCTIAPLTDSRVAALASQFPNVPFNGDKCDFMQFAMAEYYRIQNSKFYPVVKLLLCQIYQSTRPRIHCVSVDGSCRCCCMNYVYQDGNCVLDSSQNHDTSCNN